MPFQIKSSNDALQIVSQAVRSHSTTWQRIDRIEDYILRMKSLYDQEELAKQGLEWVNNWSYGKGRMKIEQIVSDEVKSIFDSLNLVDIEFETYNEDKHKDKEFIFLSEDFLRSLFSRLISRCFVDAILRDQRFHSMLGKIEYNSLSFGSCAITRDEFSYLGSANHVRTIAFEDRTSFSNPSTWVCFDSIKGDFLYKKYKEIEDAHGDEDSSTWKKKGIHEIISKLLRDAGKDDPKLTEKQQNGERILNINQWEDVERVVEKKGYAWYYYNTNNIYIAKIYQFVDGNFWETYVAVQGDVTQSNFSNTVSGFSEILFQKNHGKKSVSEVISFVRHFSITPSDHIQELRGIGKMVAEDSIRYDRKKNSIEDKLILSGSPFFNTSSQVSGEATKIAVSGGFVVMSQGIEIIPNQIQFNLRDHITSLGMDDQSFNRDTGHYSPSLNNLSNRPSKDEVQQKSAEVQQRKSARAPLKIADYSILLTQIFKDLCSGNFDGFTEDKNIYDEFICKLTEGFDLYSLDKVAIKKIIKTVKRINITPVFGDLNAIHEALAVASSGNSRRYLLTCYMIALGFSREDIAIILEEEDMGKDAEHAALENAAFYNTGEVIYSPSQDPISHCNIHFAKMDRILHGVANGEDPVAGFHYLSNALQNTEKHVNGMEGNPFYSTKFKEFKQVQDVMTEKYKQLAAEVEKLKKQAEAQAEQNAQGQPGASGGAAQGIDPKVQQDMQIKDMQVMKKIQRADAAFNQRSQQREAELAHRLKMKEVELKSDMGNAKMIADFKAELESLKASIRLANHQ